MQRMQTDANPANTNDTPSVNLVYSGTIPFFADHDLNRLVLQRCGLADMDRVKRTGKLVHQQYVKNLFGYDAGFLELLKTSTVSQCELFLKHNMTHLQSVLLFAKQYEAAYTASALLGGVNKLDPKDLASNLKYLRAHDFPAWLVDAVELMFAIYYPAGRPLVPLLDRIADRYVSDENADMLGELRKLLLFLMFRTTRLLENDISRDNRFEQVKACLQQARDHRLFGEPRKLHHGFFGFFNQYGPTETASVRQIQAELIKSGVRAVEFASGLFDKVAL